MLWKSRFRVETITFLRFYRAAYLRRGPRTRFADQGPSKTVAFLRIPSKIFMSGTWNFRIIDWNIKAIFREYFSSLHEDSGEIFKLMTFTRGPRTTYCNTRWICSLEKKDLLLCLMVNLNEPGNDLGLSKWNLDFLCHLSRVLISCRISSV